MKKFSSWVLLWSAVASSCAFADSCPAITEFSNLVVAPAGWSFEVVLPPPLPITQYHFSLAVHSIAIDYHYGHVLCKYSVCESFGCPAFLILSDNFYTQPARPNPPWDVTLGSAITCWPEDQDPKSCEFT